MTPLTAQETMLCQVCDELIHQTELYVLCDDAPIHVACEDAYWIGAAA